VHDWEEAFRAKSRRRHRRRKIARLIWRSAIIATSGLVVLLALFTIDQLSFE